MKINVVGLGYIGLPTALMFAANGISVVGTDKKQSLVKQLNNDLVTFEEDGLQELFSKALENDIKFFAEVQKADVYIVAVPTPYIKSDKRVDASYVVGAVQDILSICEAGSVIVIESTISPGTIEKYVRPLLRENKKQEGVDIHLAHAPERIIPGSMIHELTYNNRTIGADSREIGERIRDLYKVFCHGEIAITDIKTAEMTKVVENTYRDINIAFANELAKICREADLDVYEIIKIANMHPRVNILSPGPGVGGHCISVDPWFLVGDYPGLANIILSARKINDSMPEFVLNRIADIMEKEEISDLSRIGLYGLTYKENVDDVRESPTLQLLDCMKKHLAKGIKVYDPLVKTDIVDNQIHDWNEFINEIDFIIIMVGHNEIKDKLDEIRNKIVLDTRNIVNNKIVKLYNL